MLAAAAAWALGKGRELGSSRRKVWCCLGCGPGTAACGRAANPSLGVFMQFLTGITESKATRTGTPFNGGSITVVAKTQPSSLSLVYCRGGMCLWFSHISFGVPPILMNCVCTWPFSRRGGKIKMKITWFSLSDNWFLALSTVLWRSLDFFYQIICYLTVSSLIWPCSGPYWLQTTDKALKPLGLSCVINTRAQEPLVAWDSFPF